MQGEGAEAPLILDLGFRSDASWQFNPLAPEFPFKF